MKTKTQQIVRFMTLVASGLLMASASHAATQPASIFTFTQDAADDVFTTKSTSWRDPAFGDMGWTHSSDWGAVEAQKGQIVTIKMDATATPGLHPGITVWYRGADDTAADTYVVDHFYPQNANQYKKGVTDETTGEALGDIVMRHVTHGYDADGNTETVRRMRPVSDGVSGLLEVSFRAKKTGHYLFVVGGFNPDAGVDASVKHNVNINVTVADPAPAQ